MKRADLQSLKKTFTRLLLRWNREHNTRQMPWKNEKDPYKIWLSEIILQQTRVEQGLGYYNRFISAFPTIRLLANASDSVIFKLWEGLGYYTRCRNLIHTARFISKERKGKFPSTYEEIKELKGVGPYTAAAISSFAFNLPHAVVDGNVFRVLARFFDLEIPIDSASGRKTFTDLANELLDKKNPGKYNQAIMDFGSVICKPIAPLCTQCVFNKHCLAFLRQTKDQRPVKEKKLRIKKRWFYYLVLEHKNEMVIRQRIGKDIWQQLYEFPLIESSQATDKKVLLSKVMKEYPFLRRNHEVLSVSPMFRQQLSHQLIAGQFIRLRVIRRSKWNNDWIWVAKHNANNYAFPKFINQYLDEKALGLCI